MRFQAAIVAGGLGTRMQELGETPKGLFPVAGKPILEHLLTALKNYGFSEVILCLGHGSERIRGYFGDGSRWGLGLDYRVEKTPRGTAGAVRDLGSAVSKDLLIVYGDLFVEMDIGALLSFHESHRAAATLVVRRTDHPEDSDIVELAADGSISAIGRLGSGKVKGDLGCAAIWVLRAGLLAKIPKERPSDFARDIFPAALADGEALMAYRTEERVVDIGTPKRYEAFVRQFA